MKTAQEAYTNQQSRLNMFAGTEDEKKGPLRSATDMKDHKQPSIFNGTLKSYQMKGMNWLANLYYFVSFYFCYFYHHLVYILKKMMC